MTHARHTHNVMAHIALANGDHAGTRAGAGLLNGGVPCRTKDDRFIAVGALELKFWRCLCDAIGRLGWAARHWSQGQAIGDADAAQLSSELAAIFSERTRDEWSALLEPLDCCVAPVFLLRQPKQWFIRCSGISLINDAANRTRLTLVIDQHVFAARHVMANGRKRFIFRDVFRDDAPRNMPFAVDPFDDPGNRCPTAVAAARTRGIRANGTRAWRGLI